MNELERWRADLARALGPREDDEALEMAVVKELAQRARSLGPGAEGDERRQLMEGIELLHRFVSEGMSRMEEDLQTIGRQRKGIRGYAQLRSNPTSQRLHRRA